MKSRHNLWVLLPCLGCVCLVAKPADSQEHSQKLALEVQTDAELPSPEIDMLIQQLGSNTFAEREKASAGLLAGGALALEGLRNVGPSAPVEVRQRVALIRQRIEADKFASLSRSFLLDLDSSQSYGLPAWRKYRELVGATRCSKLMFLEMIRQQPALSQLLEVATDANASPVAINSLAAAASVEAFRLRAEIFDFREPHLGDAVGMLMVAATLANQTPVEISEVLISYERQSFCGYIDEAGYDKCLGKLMSAWLPKTHQSMAPLAMDCALRHDLRVGIEIARTHLTDNFDNDTRTLAFYCLARFGDETDVSKLWPFISEQKVVDQFSRVAIGEIHTSDTPPPGATGDLKVSNNMVVRINDLAITTAMILLNRDPSELYSRYEAHSKLGFTLHSLAAPPEWAEEQQRRIDAWKQQHFPPQVGS